MNGAEDRPLLVLDRKGEGRVALLLSDHAWLWARGYEGGGPHTDLLRRLAHWLMKEPDLEEERLIASARGLKLTIERRSVKDEVEPVMVTSPSGKEETITLDKSATRAVAEVDHCRRAGRLPHFFRQARQRRHYRQCQRQGTLGRYRDRHRAIASPQRDRRRQLLVGPHRR